MKNGKTRADVMRAPARQGTVLVLVMAVVAGATLMGVGLVNLGGANAVETARSGQALQAFWAAEAGLQEVLAVAHTPQPGITQLRDSVGVGNGVWSGSMGGASYSVDIAESGGGWYSVTSTGTARDGSQRRVQLRARSQGFGTDGWETDSEGGIYFATGDTLDMRVASNDRFNIWGTPRFLQSVATGAQTVNYQNPVRDPNAVDTNVFTAGLAKGAATLDFQSDHVDHVRDCADVSLTGTHRISFLPNGGFVTELRSSGNWVNPQTNLSASASIYVSVGTVVRGVVNGRYTVATAGKITIPSAGIRYNSATGASPDPHESPSFDPSQVTDVLGLVTPVAVRVDGAGSDWDGDGEMEVPIHAAVLVADGTEGFTAVRRNDFIGQPKLEVFGALSQKSRGIVGTVSGRGFLKHYLHDVNLADRSPPCWPQRGYEVSVWRQSP